MEYTFLELVQMTARESGTIPNNQPLTVKDQTGRLGKVVYWVNLAWNRIQTSRMNWLWMHGEFEGTTSPGLSAYSANQFGISRFSRWISFPNTLSIYRKSLGKSDEQFISPLEHWTYKRLYDIGAQEPARPGAFAVSPSGLLCLGPTPDDEYVVRGQFYKSPQHLVEDDDIPELPRQYRPLIAWNALILLSQHDEGGFAAATALENYRMQLRDLERDQLPTLVMFPGRLGR